MVWVFIPVNILFLTFRFLLVMITETQVLHYQLKQTFTAKHHSRWHIGLVGYGVFCYRHYCCFTFSSADSALVSLTTSFAVDIIHIEHMEEQKQPQCVVGFILLFVSVFLVIILFFLINNKSILDLLFTIASYTYGPLLEYLHTEYLLNGKISDTLVPILL